MVGSLGRDREGVELDRDKIELSSTSNFEVTSNSSLTKRESSVRPKGKLDALF